MTIPVRRSAAASAPALRNALVRGTWTDGLTTEQTTVITVTDSSAFVITENLPSVGARVDLDLSFGSIRARVATRVSHVRLSLDPGAPAGFAVEFEPDAIESSSLARLVALTTARGPASCRSGDRGEQVRLLHVESNKLLRDIFAYAVDRYFGTRATRPLLVQAASFSEAMAIEEPFGAAVIEHDLPDAVGPEAILHLRARAPKAWMVGVGLGGSSTRERMLAAGADVYVQKPIVVTDVLYSLELLMREVQDAAGAA